MEMHLVHKADDGKLAVVALPIVAGASNTWLEPAWGDLPTSGDKRELDAKINAADLVPAKHVYLHYSGSLTTPPCTEGVSWFVWKTPIEMSAAKFSLGPGRRRNSNWCWDNGFVNDARSRQLHRLLPGAGRHRPRCGEAPGVSGPEERLAAIEAAMGLRKRCGR